MKAEFQTIYPRGPGAATGPLPRGYVMVSRWVGVSEAPLWIANGGTFVPREIGRATERVYVTLFGSSLPAGIGRDSIIRIDFAVPQAALAATPAGNQLLQPFTNVPIHNVSIHIPWSLNVDDVLRNRGV